MNDVVKSTGSCSSNERYGCVITKTTPSRAARAKISAQETVALQAASTRVLMVSMTSKPLAEFWFGNAFFSPVKEAVSSNRIEASQPYIQNPRLIKMHKFS